MTTKDYELVAKAFDMEMTRLNGALSLKGKVSSYNDGEISGLKMGISNMAFILGQHDPTFDKVKFLKDCGVK